MKKFIAIACILALCLGVLSGCMERVDTNAVDTSAPVGVVLINGETKIDVTVGDWEAKRTQIKTVDYSLPGTTKEYEFTGVTLASLMEIAGASNCTQIVVRSSDGWEAFVAAADALAYDILITDDYVGGKDIPADAGGPIKMVFPATEHPELNEMYDAYAWQWYVSEIEFVK